MEYLDRDLSWLSFNERVLLEAAKETVPLLERINFLSIYSSNLDEFYRVRIPALMALQKIRKENNGAEGILKLATDRIQRQLEQFGKILTQQLIPLLRENSIHVVYGEPIPALIKPAVQEYFFSQLLAYLQPVELRTRSGFFPENNQLYIVAIIEHNDQERAMIIKIPTASVSRFFHAEAGGIHYIVFIDDIIKENLSYIFPSTQIKGSHSFKITRDADLGLQDEYAGDIADRIEKQIAKRDLGFATRFLYSPGLPAHVLERIISVFNLSNASIVAGGA